MSSEELRKEITAYLAAHRLARIAVSDGDNPIAHSVYYINIGLRMYFESDQNSQKISILRSNPRISYTIDEDTPDWRQIRGIQGQGKANILGERSTGKLTELYARKFPILDEIGGLPKHHIFVEVVPDRLYFLDFAKEFGHRSLYYPDDEDRPKLQW